MPVAVAANQVLAGRAFERFAGAADRQCPASRLRTITPGDLDLQQENFLDGLATRSRARVAATNDAERRCADRNGLACPTTATLAAFDRAGLIPAFVGFACRTPVAPR